MEHSEQDTELDEEEFSSDDEEAESFDVQELEREALKAVTEFSTSLSRELKIGWFLDYLTFFIGFFFLPLICCIACNGEKLTQRC